MTTVKEAQQKANIWHNPWIKCQQKLRANALIKADKAREPVVHSLVLLPLVYVSWFSVSNQYSPVNNLAAIRKCNIVQNTDLTAKRAQSFKAQKRQRNQRQSSNTIAIMTLFLTCTSWSSLVVFLTVSSGSAGHANRHQATDNRLITTLLHLLSAQGRISLEIQMPMAICSMFHLEDHWVFLPLYVTVIFDYILYSVSLRTSIFCRHSYLTLALCWSEIKSDSLDQWACRDNREVAFSCPTGISNHNYSTHN